jgi:hypothetical protein
MLLSCYRFPLNNKELLKKWLAAVKRDKWEPSATSYICSRHFTDSCFRQYQTQFRLKADAVPSVFDYPQHLQATVKERRPLVKHSVTTLSSQSCDVSASLPDNTVELPSASVLAIHNYAMMTSPRGVKRKLEHMLEQEKQRRVSFANRLKVARRRLFRQQAKIKSMKDIISELKKRNDL